MIDIDLNCDMGEGVGNEADLMPFISSCNIACGGHAGDQASMQACVSLALEHGVQMGAHPSYPDRDHFGRRSMVLEKAALKAALESQLGVFEAVLRDLGATLHHIKAHGALYNDLAKGGSLAEDYLEALAPYRGRAALFVPAGSVFEVMAGNAGFATVAEAFADRAYTVGGQLAPRNLPGAVLKHPERVLEQLREMVLKGRVRTLAGGFLPIAAQTYCIHGDTPGAFEILAYLSRELPKYEIRVAS